MFSLIRILKTLVLGAALLAPVAHAQGDASNALESRFCSQYDRQPQVCDRTFGCAFDNRYNACVDRNGGGNTPYPNPDTQCWQFNRDPRGCDNAAPVCRWDRWSNSCIDGGGNGPGPGGRQVTTTVYCASNGFGQSSCPVDGTIVAADVQQQLSRESCDQGTSWGFYGNAVWVSQGCQAQFQVTYAY